MLEHSQFDAFLGFDPGLECVFDHTHFSHGVGADHQFGVAAGGGGDDHAVDVRVVEQLLRVGVDLVHPQFRRQAGGLAWGRVGDGDEAGAGDMPRRCQTVEAAHAAGTDQAQADVPIAALWPVAGFLLSFALIASREAVPFLYFQF